MINDGSIYKKDLSLTTENFAVKDLRLAQSKDSTKCVSYVRDVNLVTTNQEVSIPNFTSYEFELVDSLTSVMKVQKELSQNPGDYLEKWSFLKNWDDLELDDRLKNYDEFYSYELNFFLKKKDPEFFDEICRPFISSKMEKKLIDYY